MVAASFGILMGIGTLISYGGYNIINSLTGNNSSAANITQVTLIHSNQSNNTTTMMNSNQSNNITGSESIPLNISTNIEENMKLLDIKNTSINENNLSLSTQQKIQNIATSSIIETQYESNNIHEGIEHDDSDMLIGREIDYKQEYYTNEIDTYQENLSDKVQNQNSDNESDVRFKTNDTVYQEQEMDYTESPERVNPKLTLNINSNKNNLEKSEDSKSIYDFEPFPSLKRKLDNERNIDDIPDNPLYETYYETEHKVKVQNPLYPIPVQNPLYPIPKKNDKQHQENVLHLNEMNSQSYEKINPKLILNYNKNINLKDDETMDNDISSVENHNMEPNVNIPKAKSLINEDLAVEDLNPAIVDLIDSLVSKKDSENLEIEIIESEISLEEEVLKSFLGNNEVISEDMNVKTLFTSYAEIAGIVVASVLIVTGLIFLSIRQARKHQRQSKIERRYAENETGRVNTITYAYTNEGNDVE